MDGGAEGDSWLARHMEDRHLESTPSEHGADRTELSASLTCDALTEVRVEGEG